MLNYRALILSDNYSEPFKLSLFCWQQTYKQFSLKTISNLQYKRTELLQVTENTVKLLMWKDHDAACQITQSQQCDHPAKAYCVVKHC